MYIEAELNGIKNKQIAQVKELEKQKETLKGELLEAITADKCNANFHDRSCISNRRRIDEIKTDFNRVKWKIEACNKIIEFLSNEETRQIVKDEFEKVSQQ